MEHIFHIEDGIITGRQGPNGLQPLFPKDAGALAGLSLQKSTATPQHFLEKVFGSDLTVRGVQGATFHFSKFVIGRYHSYYEENIIDDDLDIPYLNGEDVHWFLNYITGAAPAKANFYNLAALAELTKDYQLMYRCVDEIIKSATSSVPVEMEQLSSSCSDAYLAYRYLTGEFPHRLGSHPNLWNWIWKYGQLYRYDGSKRQYSPQLLLRKVLRYWAPLKEELARFAWHLVGGADLAEFFDHNNELPDACREILPKIIKERLIGGENSNQLYLYEFPSAQDLGYENIPAKIRSEIMLDCPIAEALLEHINGTTSFIMGGYCVRALLDKDWESDIDIFTTDETLWVKLRDKFQENKVAIETYDGELYGPDSNVIDHTRIVIAEGILPNIDVVAVLNLADAIAHSDLSCCRVIFTGDEVYVVHPEICQMRGSSTNWTGNDREKERIDKYRLRGFTITSQGKTSKPLVCPKAEDEKQQPVQSYDSDTDSESNCVIAQWRR